MKITDEQIEERANELLDGYCRLYPYDSDTFPKSRGHYEATILRLKDARNSLTYLVEGHSSDCGKRMRFITTEIGNMIVWPDKCTCGLDAYIAELEELLGIAPSTPEQ